MSTPSPLIFCASISPLRSLPPSLASALPLFLSTPSPSLPLYFPFSLSRSRFLSLSLFSPCSLSFSPSLPLFLYLPLPPPLPLPLPLFLPLSLTLRSITCSRACKESWVKKHMASMLPMPHKCLWGEEGGVGRVWKG